MPANLTPDYREAEARYRQARTAEEKIAALEEMLARIPKHKGTEKLQADLKRRLSKLRHQETRLSGGKRHAITVPREGCAQVALLGAPNAGKSQVLASLTNARPEVAPYPYTTQMPAPGMVLWENVQIQLVDLPPLSRDHTPGWVSTILRNGDAALLVADLSTDEVLDQVEMVLEVAGQMKVFPVAPGQAPAGAPPSHCYLRCLLLGWQADAPGAPERLEILREFYSDRYPLEVASRDDAAALERLKGRLFDFLELMRVYTRAPGGEPDRSRPFVLPRGSTLRDVAGRIHKDFADRLKFGRLWGSAPFEGQRVSPDYVLADQDVVELHL